MKRQQEGKLSFHINHAIVFNGSTLINLVHLNELQKSLMAMPEEPLDSAMPWDEYVEGMRGTFSKEYPASDDTLNSMTAQIFHNDGDRIMPTLIRYMEQRQRQLQRWGSGIADFDGPVSMFWGVQDPVSVVAMADTWKMMSPQIELHKWADGAHWPSIENPERVAKIILDRFAFSPY
jgi:pimeloyl-ACP methyl ester carboxylesterase